ARGGQTILNGNMTEEKPRKTLTLKKAAAPSGSADDRSAGRRTRSGARARPVAQTEREYPKEAAAAANAAPAPAAGRPGADAPGGRKSNRERPYAEQNAPMTPERPRVERRPSDRGRSRARGSETFPVFAPCPQGLEDALY